MRRLALTLSLAAGLLLALTAVAQARPPLRESGTNSFEGAASCGGFEDQFSGTNSVRTTISFDRHGNAVREKDKVMFGRSTSTRSPARPCW